MARVHAQNHQTKRSHKQNNSIVTLVAGFAGMGVGVLASVGMIAPMLRADIASATAGISHQIVHLAPADAILSDSQCVAPAAGSAAAKPATAQARSPQRQPLLLRKLQLLQ